MINSSNVQAGVENGPLLDFKPSLNSHSINCKFSIASRARTFTLSCGRSAETGPLLHGARTGEGPPSSRSAYRRRAPFFTERVQGGREGESTALSLLPLPRRGRLKGPLLPSFLPAPSFLLSALSSSGGMAFPVYNHTAITIFTFYYNFKIITLCWFCNCKYDGDSDQIGC